MRPPCTPAFVDIEYRYDVVAVDPENEGLSYRVIDPQPGMFLSPSGVFTWQPDATQLGETTVQIEVEDDRGGIAVQEFVLPVLAANSTPVIISHPQWIAREDETYTYNIEAIDADAGDTVTVSLDGYPDDYPAWLTFTPDPLDSSKAALSGTPLAGDVTPAGEPGHPILVRATDSKGVWRTQTYHLRVVAAASTEEDNAAPSFVSGPDSLATAGQPYQAALVVSDPDPGDTIAVSPLEALPDWMTIAPLAGVANTYRITGTPGEEHAGELSLRFRAADSRGASVDDAFPLRIVLPNRPPIVEADIPSAVRAGDELLGRLRVSEPDGDSFTFTQTGGPAAIDIDEFGVVRWPTLAQDAAASPYLLEVDVTDSAGNTVSVTHEILVSDEKLKGPGAHTRRTA